MMIAGKRVLDLDDDEPRGGEAGRSEPALFKVRLKDLDVTDAYGGAFIKGGVPPSTRDTH